MSGPVAPNRLLRVTRFLDIPDKFAPGVWARGLEALKFFTSTASVSGLVKPPILRHLFATVSVVSTGLMNAFYGNKGVQWLGLQGSTDQEHGTLSASGKAMTLWGAYPARDAVSNAGNFLNVVSTIASALSRANRFAGDPAAIQAGTAKPKPAAEVLSGVGIALTGLMAALETPFAEWLLFSKTARAANAGGAAGFVAPPAGDPQASAPLPEGSPA